MDHPRLQRAILQTLAWFDVFDYPLTIQELHCALWRYDAPVSIEQLWEYMSGHSGAAWQITDGFVHATGREATIRARQQAAGFIEHKVRIARRALKRIRWIPFMRAVFICNTVAFGWPKPDSDIDVFIIVRSGRLWLTRFLISITLHVFGFRRGKKAIADRICLSFYVTDVHMNIRDVALDDADVYLSFWLTRLIPLYDPHNLHAEIMKQNAWAAINFPKAMHVHDTHDRWRVPDGRISYAFKRMFEQWWGTAYGNLLEHQARTLQKTKMRRNAGSLQDEKDSRVVISDSMLKFHENDRRKLYHALWQSRFETLCDSI